jgi:hypothetical protein
MSVIRVFPRKTSFTPDDDMVFVGDPPLWRPEAEAVHVSVTFTWDVAEGARLVEAWRQYYPVVRIGGPAWGDVPGAFTPGLYVKQGVTFTSRGCNNRCPWCFVPSREGKVRLLPIADGHIVQDNNLLQTPRDHQEAVYAMLKRQGKAATFSGGIQASLVDDWVADQFRQLRIHEVWLACDSDGAIRPLREATQRLSFLSRDKLRCYVLVGFNGETVTGAARRLAEVWDAGCMPFAQFYRDGNGKRPALTPEWQRLVREWSRPAAMRVMHRGTP